MGNICSKKSNKKISHGKVYSPVQNDHVNVSKLSNIADAIAEGKKIRERQEYELVYKSKCYETFLKASLMELRIKSDSKISQIEEKISNEIRKGKINFTITTIGYLDRNEFNLIKKQYTGRLLPRMLRNKIYADTFQVQVPLDDFKIKISDDINGRIPKYIKKKFASEGVSIIEKIDIDTHVYFFKNGQILKQYLNDLQSEKITLNEHDMNPIVRVLKIRFINNVTVSSNNIE